jgi:hypothetical protein
MEIGVEKDLGNASVTVFRLRGDLVDEDPLVGQAQAEYDAGMRNLLLDLSGVKYISSTGLRALHKVFMMLRGDEPGDSDESVRTGIAAGTYTSPHLKLLRPTKTAMKTLSLGGYDMFLGIYKKEDKAIASFG